MNTNPTGSLIGLLIAIGLYFAPTLLGLLRKKRNALAIFFMNLFLGWTVIGWIFAMIWAATKDSILVSTEKRS